MPKLKLTASNLAKIKAPSPSGKPEIFWDTELVGFGVLASAKKPTKSFIVQRDMPGGQTRRFTVGNVSEIDLDKARDEAADLLHGMRRGVDPKANRRGRAVQTVKQVFDDFLEARNDLRETSKCDYRSFIAYLESWHNRAMISITADMITDRHREIQKEVAEREAARRKAKGLDADDPDRTSIPGGSCANMAMIALQTIWTFQANRTEGFAECPVTRALKGRWFPTASRTRIVPSDRLGEFYRAVDGLSNRTARDYLLLLTFSGLRRTEAGCLRWDWIDFSHRVIRLPASVTKADRAFNLPMSSFVFDLLVARRSLGVENAYVFPGRSKAGYFTDPGEALTTIATTTGIRISSHDLRRVFVSTASNCNITPYELKMLVNHSTGAGDITAAYIVMSTEQLRTAAEKVCARLKELCGIATQPPAENVTSIVR